MTKKFQLSFLALILISFFTNITASANVYQGSASYVPAGTPMAVTLNTTLGSEFTQVGQTFTANLSSPIYAGGQVLAPPGSQVQGVVTEVTPAGRGGKPGSLDLRLTNVITPTGARIPLSASIDKVNFKLSADGGRTSHFTKATVGGAAGGALSGLIGSAIGGGSKGKATAIGTGIGAGVGILGGAFKKGRDLTVQQGTQIPFKLDAPLQAAANAAPPVQQVRPNDFGSYQQQPSGGYPTAQPGFAQPQGGFQAPQGGYQQQTPTNPYL